MWQKLYFIQAHYKYHLFIYQKSLTISTIYKKIYKKICIFSITLLINDPQGLPLQHMRNNPQQWANNTKHVKASPMSKAYKGPLILRTAYKIVAFCHGFGLLCCGETHIPKGQKEGFVVGEARFSRHLSSISLLLFGSTKIIRGFFFFLFLFLFFFYYNKLEEYMTY